MLVVAVTFPMAIVVADLVVGVGPMVVVVVAKNPAAGLEHAIVVAMVAVVPTSMGVHIV